MAQITQDVTETRSLTAAPFASLACGMNGHVFRVVTEHNQPVGLECSRCARTWETAETTQARP